MPKVSRREKRDRKRDAKIQYDVAINQQDDKKMDVPFSQPNRKPLQPLTDKQNIHIESCRYDKMVIATGSAGTGKTFISAAVAAELYLQKQYDTIIITRPSVEAGETMGYLPGDLDEKYEPFLRPFRKGLIDRMGSNKFIADYQKSILPIPLQFMRGETFDNSIILLDEAQNITITQMKMLITRIGINTKLFISGDTEQTDLQEESGLEWFVRQIRLQHKPYEIIEYSDNDSVRSDFCKDMLKIIANEV